MPTKHCKIGDHEAELSEFGPHASNIDRLCGSCRACSKAKYKRKYAARSAESKKKVRRDRFQVAAFHTMYKAAKIGGKSNREALISGICGSCDEIFDKLPEGSIDRWFAFKAVKPEV